VVFVDAIGEQGGLDALVDEVLRGGAFWQIVVVLEAGTEADVLGVLVRQRDDLGAEAVLEGVLTGLRPAVVGDGAGGVDRVLSVDFSSLLGGEGLGRWLS
jgi:hypothetical protein